MADDRRIISVYQLEGGAPRLEVQPGLIPPMVVEVLAALVRMVVDEWETNSEAVLTQVRRELGDDRPHVAWSLQDPRSALAQRSTAGTNHGAGRLRHQARPLDLRPHCECGHPLRRQCEQPVVKVRPAAPCDAQLRSVQRRRVAPRLMPGQPIDIQHQQHVAIADCFIRAQQPVALSHRRGAIDVVFEIADHVVAPALRMAPALFGLGRQAGAMVGLLGGAEVCVNGGADHNWSIQLLGQATMPGTVEPVLRRIGIVILTSIQVKFWLKRID